MDQDQGTKPAEGESVPGDAAAAPEQRVETPETGASTPPSEASRATISGGPQPMTSALGAAIAALQEHATKTHDRLLRTAADLENYKRRARRDVQESAQRAEEQVVVAFLPVLDNLERALEHVRGVSAEEPAAATDGAASRPLPSSMLSGLDMVQKQFLATLARYGIEPLATEGQSFDPQLHEAIQQQPSPLPRNTVVQELQRGYVRGGRLVRPAMVVVSSGPPAGSAAEPPAGERRDN